MQARSLSDVGRLAIVIVGFGARHAHVERLAATLPTSPVQFLPYQPEAYLPDSLSSADVHYVGLAPGLAGYVVPSRVYGILAAGRPILAAVDEESETAELIRTIGCGLVVPPHDPEGIAQAIRSLAAGEHDVEAMGTRGRRWIERESNREIAVQPVQRTPP